MFKTFVFSGHNLREEHGHIVLLEVVCSVWQSTEHIQSQLTVYKSTTNSQSDLQIRILYYVCIVLHRALVIHF